jgi:hypothetical protein
LIAFMSDMNLKLSDNIVLNAQEALVPRWSYSTTSLESDSIVI